jgi:hypothetical protein
MMPSQNWINFSYLLADNKKARALIDNMSPLNASLFHTEVPLVLQLFYHRLLNDYTTGKTEGF